MLMIWLKGVAMGLAIAVPVGPIGVLCIRRTLAQGRWVGLVTGLGAATADALYGVIAAFGLSAISELLVQNTRYLRFFGGLFLIYLGLTTFLAKPEASLEGLNHEKRLNHEKSLNHEKRLNSEEDTNSKLNSDQASSLVSAYLSTLALTLTNPATILSFIAIFAGLGITQTSYLRSITLVSGVFTGSSGWWLVLVSGVIYLRNRLTPERLVRFNRWSTKIFAVLIMGFGVVALAA